MLNKNRSSSLNSELTFLITCSQTKPSKDDIAFIRSYLNEQHWDVNTLTELANQHGILPLVYKTILALNADTPIVKTKEGCLDSSSLNAEHLTPNAEILRELKAHYMSISQRNMLMSAELIRIMKLLEDNDIEALTFKGPVLSQMAYGDITLRQYSDLDILVSEEEVLKAALVLVKHGYSSDYTINILKNKTCLNVTNDLGFHNHKNGILVELHWKLFREKIAQHLHFSQISDHKQSININGKFIPTLSTEMLLVYLCLHGSKHAWERIEWICDIDRLICSNQDIDWNKVLTIAQEMETRTSLYLGLKLSHVLFHTPLLEKILLMTETERISNLVAKTYTILNNILPHNEGYKKYNAIHMYQMDLLDTKFKKLKHLYTTYFGISKNDCQVFQLPSGLKFLYIFIKPFRVAIKYIQYGK